MFDTVLVANRGEIAVRVIRTLRALGIRSVAVYSDADAGARHVAEADEAVRLGPAAAADSYLNTARVLDAAARSGAQALHPGYGFLSENAAFAQAAADAGVVFIGPPPSAISAMGDKITAKETVAAAGVPVVPGAGRRGMSDAELIGALNGAGYPLLIKPSAGGGGKGMGLVRSAAELPDALSAARRTARAAFGDDTLLVERFVEQPRHIEIQVLADAHGSVVHLGERECSLQRRHQKIIEEAPSPLLDGACGAARRAAMGAAAVRAARSVGYVSAGTVEFIVGGRDPDDFFFLEMNTRLQVEHPVTELVTGLDLVEWQLRVAAGEALDFTQQQVRLTGHAIEARVYAEDPARGFLPAGGKVLAVAEPAVPPAPAGTVPAVRVDSALMPGTVVGSSYDPMLAKVIAHGPDRATALRRLDSALAQTAVLGVTTNVAFLRALLADPEVTAGRLDTGLAERTRFPAPGSPDAGPPDEVLAAAALDRLLAREPSGPLTDPWELPDGWRAGGPGWTKLRIGHGPGAVTEVRVRGLASAGAEVAVGDGEPVPARAAAAGAPGPGTLTVSYGDGIARYACARSGPAGGGDAGDGQDSVLWLSRDGRTWALTAQPAVTSRSAAGAAGGAGDGVVRSPMPGTVVAVLAESGQPVSAGQRLVIVSAMKMEHTVTAPAAGVLAGLTARAGQPVKMDEILAVVEPAQAAEGG